jgi:surfactin synthase thioesterase subunit
MGLIESAWLVPSASAAASVGLRLLCIPFAGGGVAAFRGWSSHLAGVADVSVLQLPGRGSRFREPCCTSLIDAARQAAGEVARLDDGPVAVFGHSLGALLGFEIARELARRGRPPVGLFVSARPAPILGERRTPIAGLPDAEFVAEVQSRYDGIPALVLQDPELLGLLLPALRADIAMLESYRYAPGPSIDCPIVALGGADDPHATAIELEAWKVESAVGHRVEIVPGGHFFLQTARDVVLRIVEGELAALTLTGREYRR